MNFYGDRGNDIDRRIQGEKVVLILQPDKNQPQCQPKHAAEDTNQNPFKHEYLDNALIRGSHGFQYTDITRFFDNRHCQGTQ